MRVHVVSDVHGTADALAVAGDGADMLICLGDMLLFLDYEDHTQGIFAELYGAEHAREYIDLRTARRFDEARQLTAGIAARLTADHGTDLRTLTERAIRRQYAALFGVIGEPEFAAKLGAVGAVDVLCTHIPPAVPELLYDTAARRLETGSQALLDVIKRTQPRYALFGHVHNPLVRRVRVGRTECVNVGHFRATRVPYVVEL